MRGLKVIPLFLALIMLSYAGMLFVEANHDPVVIQFANHKSPPTALGLVVLTSSLIGMVICGVLCSIEMLALYVQNQSLRKKVGALRTKLGQAPVASDAPKGELVKPGNIAS